MTLLVMILTGCTQKGETPKTASLKDVPPGFCTGYEEAEFERFNSFASENGLGDSRIWIQGSYEDVSALENEGTHTLYAIVTDDENNQWVVPLDIKELSANIDYQTLFGHTLVFRGVYTGYSKLFNMPVINMMGIYDRNTGDLINSIAFNQIYADHNEDNTPSKEEEPAPEPAKEDNETIRPEIKEAIDSYESFMDEYIAFMKKFDESDNTAALLLEYANFMSEYAQFNKKIEALENDLNDAESIYYLEVVNRVNTKMLKELQ